MEACVQEVVWEPRTTMFGLKVKTKSN